MLPMTTNFIKEVHMHDERYVSVESTNLGELFCASTRYYLGRMSIAVPFYCDMLCQHWDSLPKNWQDVIQRDVEDEFKRDDAARLMPDRYPHGYPLGHDCDRSSWERVRRMWSAPVTQVKPKTKAKAKKARKKK